MTPYRFTRVLVWDSGTGGNVQLARNQRITVTDPETGARAPGLTQNGQAVTAITSDSTGHVDFTCTIHTIRLTGPSGLWQDVTAPAALAEAATAADSATAAANAAANAAQAAQDAADLVDAPAKTVLDAIVGGDSSTIFPQLAARYTKAAADAAFAPAPQLSLALLRAALAGRDTAPARIVFAGSSTTANATPTGYVSLVGDAIRAAYPGGVAWPTSTLAAAHGARTARSNGVQIINAGVAGTQVDTYLDATARQQIAALSPGVVVHMVGSNDFAAQRDPNNYRADLTASLDAIDTAQPVPPLHILVHPYHRLDRSVSSPIPWTAYRDAMRAVASSRPRTMVVDLDPAFREAGILDGDPRHLIGSDKIHATPAGHALLADLLCIALNVPPAAPIGTGVASIVVDMFRPADGVSQDLATHVSDTGGTWTIGAGTYRCMPGGLLVLGPTGYLSKDVGTTRHVVECDVNREAGTVGIAVASNPGAAKRLTVYTDDTGLWKWGWFGLADDGVPDNFIAYSVTVPPELTLTTGTKRRLRVEHHGAVTTLHVDGTLIGSYTWPDNVQVAVSGRTHVGLRLSAITTRPVVQGFIARPIPR